MRKRDQAAFERAKLALAKMQSRGVRTLTEHERDLLIPCPARSCGVAEGFECVGTAPGIVHFGRRLKRLLYGLRA